MLPIVPIAMTTKGGFRVDVTAIDTINRDEFLSGEINSAEWSGKFIRWTSDGHARDMPDSCNLDMRAANLSDLARIAKALFP